MLDGSGADILAGAAGGAGPDGITTYGLHQIAVRLSAGGLAEAGYYLHGRKWLVGVEGGTSILASFAEGAGIGIENILPGEVGYFGRTEFFHILIFEVKVGQFAFGTAIRKHIVGGGGDNVPEFSIGDKRDKTHNQQEMQPPGCFVY